MKEPIRASRNNISRGALSASVAIADEASKTANERSRNLLI